MKKNKLTLLIIVFLVLSGLCYFNIKRENKDFKVVKINNEKSIISDKYKEIIKTAEKNVFICKKETNYSLIFINEKNKINEIDGLKGIGIFIDGLIPVMIEKYGVIDVKGKIVVPIEYDEVYVGENKRILLKKYDEYMLYDSKKILELNIDSVYQLDNNKFVYNKNKKMGIMNFQGKIIIPNEYDEISSFVDQVFIGEKDSKYSLYNLNNKKITKNYDYIEQISNNIYKGGSVDIGKYAFLSEYFSSEEKYDNIVKITDNYYIGEYNNRGIVDILNKDGEIKINIKKNEAKQYIDKLLNKKENK